jgi:hypothetical protein
MKTVIRKRLTKETIEAARPVERPDGKVRQLLIRDDKDRGLGICIGKKTKSFFIERAKRGSGETKRFVIGEWPLVSVEEARKRYHEYAQVLDQGRDPVDERRKARAKTIMLREALELAISTAKAKNRAERTIEKYRDYVETYLSSWLDRELRSITRQEVADRHKKIAQEISASGLVATSLALSASARRAHLPSAIRAPLPCADSRGRASRWSFGLE